MKTWHLMFVLTLVAFMQQTNEAKAGLMSALVDGVGSQSLYTFNSSTPGTGTLQAISGLNGETLLGLDFRPSTLQLYGLSNASSLYTIDLASGVATQVGPTFSTTLSGTSFGFDFNPTIDRIRVVSDADQNLVLNPNTGLVQLVATPVFYEPGDVNFAANPNVVHHAYTGNVLGAPVGQPSQLYAIDSNLGVLVTQNNNDGNLATVGPLGLSPAQLSSIGGFDIDADGIGFVALNDSLISSSLYTVDLGTGALTEAGLLPFNVTGVTAVPEPSSLALLGLVVGGVAAHRRKMKRAAS